MSSMILTLLAAGLAPHAPHPATSNPNRPDDTAALIGAAAMAHEHLMRGDTDGYRRTIDLAPDFTLMDPFGGRVTRRPSGDEDWQRIGRFFRSGRDAAFEPVATYGSGDLIVLVAHERADVGIGNLDPQLWQLRVTLVFRKDAGSWRLVHRHADPLVPGIDVGEAARLTRGGRVPNGVCAERSEGLSD